MMERSVYITFGSGALVEGGNVPKAPINLAAVRAAVAMRSEEHTSELQSHSFTSYAVFFLQKKTI